MEATETIAVSTGPLANPGDAKEAAWQDRLLPLMATTLAFLTLFFCASLTYETISVQRHIESSHEIDLAPLISKLDADSGKDSKTAELEFRAKVLATLETNVIERRYHQATAAAIGRTYLIFLGFATGMVLSLAGAMFILGKVKEDPTSIAGSGSSFKATLRSGSPGLVMAVLGTVLMLSTIFSRADITVTDRALYLGPSGEMAEFVTGAVKDKTVSSTEDILKNQVKPLLNQDNSKQGGAK